MSLNFSTADIEDKSVVSYTDENGRELWHPYVESIAFNGMAIGIGDITEKNWEEWHKRYVQLQIAYGTPADQHYLSREVVRKFIGFGSNVGYMTPAAWKKKLFTLIERAAESRISAEIRKAEEEASA